MSTSNTFEHNELQYLIAYLTHANQKKKKDAVDEESRSEGKTSEAKENGQKPAVDDVDEGDSEKD